MTPASLPFVPSEVEGPVRVGCFSLYRTGASTSLGTNGEF
jgi:hypothetical protein